MADNPELESLRNLILEAHAIVSSAKLPEGRSARATEVLNAAIAVVEDLLESRSRPAATLGKQGGLKTAQRGPEYFKNIAAMRKKMAGGRPPKQKGG